MEIIKNLDGDKLTIELVGMLDTTTSPDLQKVVDGEIAEVKTLILDLAKLEYISSAGLRVLLVAQKKMSIQGVMEILNANKAVMEVFKMTGFSKVLNVK